MDNKDCNPARKLDTTNYLEYLKWCQEEVNNIRNTDTYKWLGRRYGDAVAVDLLRVFLDQYKGAKDGKEG